MDITKIKLIRKKRKRGDILYYNLACSMDTETSSFYNEQNEKVAIMYTHQWKIGDEYYIGRTWDEFREVVEKLNEKFNLSNNKRLVVYVHNLPYEFGFFRKEIPIDECFATDDRKAIKVLSGGVEFRDSLILTQKPLEAIGAEVGVPKLKEDMDYSLIRTPKTPLTEKELQYCYNDVEILQKLIEKKMREDGNITKIPCTNTGYVRNYVRKNCYSKKNYTEYRKLMKSLTITVEEYKMLKQCFQGGFTHANARYVGETIEEEMESQDFTSSYPTVMLTEKFPMSRAMKCNAKTLDELYKLEEKNYGFMVDISFNFLEETEEAPDHTLSESKCIQISNSSVIDNGRVVFAEYARTMMTNVDLQTFTKFYKFEDYKINKVVCYRMGYLPKPIAECIWHFYKRKTELKDVEGSEDEYQILKGLLNAIYGMIVTDIVRDEIIYIDDWDVQKADVEEQVEAYNESATRFLFYPWGVWITAYARKNLLEGILEAGSDYVYSDTDSRKIKNPHKHRKYVEEYNSEIIEKVKTAFNFWGIAYEAPKDIHGVEHPIGVWDYDGTYTKFKTLGAKRYVYQTNKNEVGFTVAGIKKSIGKVKVIRKIRKEKEVVNYEKRNKKKVDTSNIKRRYVKKGKKVILENGYIDFDKFNSGFQLSKEESGKLTHTYIDEERSGYVADYMGNEYEYIAKTGIHLEKTTSSITMSDDFENYLLGLKKYKNM